MQGKRQNKEIHILLFGRVQGVGLRFQTREKSQALGLTGFVRNLLQGQVEILAQGSKENLEQLLTWLQSGEISAEIQDIKTQWQEISEIFPDFSVRY